MSDVKIGDLDVSRETFERLELFSALISKWNPVINLVSKSTISDLWNRHIVDSTQFYQPNLTPKVWLDIGSGGGLPGVVLAAILTEKSPETEIRFIESDMRKSTFLRTALREMGLQGTVITDRIEAVTPQQADVVSARALADLTTLFDLSSRHLVDGGLCLFAKGKTWQAEVGAAQKSWRFDCDPIKSITDPEAAILRIGGIVRV